MSFKVSNTQLKLLIPIVHRESQLRPDDVELNEILERLVTMADFRGLSVNDVTPEGAEAAREFRYLVEVVDTEKSLRKKHPAVEVTEPKPAKPSLSDAPLLRTLTN